MDWRLTSLLIKAVQLCRAIESRLLLAIAARQLADAKPAPPVMTSGSVVVRGDGGEFAATIAKAFGAKPPERTERAGQVGKLFAVDSARPALLVCAGRATLKGKTDDKRRSNHRTRFG